MVIFLTGAPDADALSWECEDLTVPLLSCYYMEDLQTKADEAQSTISGPSWRSLPFEREHLRTGLTQPTLQPDQQARDIRSSQDADETSFLDTTDLSFVSTVPSEDNSQALSSNEEAEVILSQYYEHSFAVHEEIPSSQIISGEAVGDRSFLSTSTEFSTTSVHDIATSQSGPCRRKPTSDHLSDLEGIPNASYLQSIIPQTMTVNLIVGIIAMPQPRVIQSRRGGRMLELVEMIVGDETKAGFGVNLWLPPTTHELDRTHQAPGLRAITTTLRPQDVILARNVALSTFNGQVYGQSLRKDMTKLDLLYRNGIDSEDERGAYETRELDEADDRQVVKVKKVRDWVMRFIGNAARPHHQEQNSEGRNSSKQVREVHLLPPDTQ